MKKYFILAVVLLINSKSFSMNHQEQVKDFIEAAGKGNIEKVKNYINKGININAKHDPKGTALIYATINNQPVIVKFLLSKEGIDVNEKRLLNKGETALMLAAFYNRPEIARMLLRHPEIDVNMQNEHGFTALMWAAQGGHERIVNMLLAYPKIDIHIKDDKGNTAHKFALMAGHDKIARLLKK